MQRITIPPALMSAIITLALLGLRDAALAALRKVGDVLVERARATPDKKDDAKAEVIKAALDAFALAVKSGDSDAIAKAGAVVEAIAK